MKKLLIIGHTFPEPSTTAAGGRMMQLIKLFQEESFEIIFASTAVISERSVDLPKFGISVKNILLNDSEFDLWVKELSPEIVIFDRFITEEQFGWRITESCPKALKILDTEDLHFLRKSREEAVRKNLPLEQANLFSDTAKRELASILRCDLSLIISEYEMELLQDKFGINSNILFYLPFLINGTKEVRNLPFFEERKHFITIGNLFHQPNVDGVLQLKKLWPKIREKLPNAELHIYGAYAPPKINELHNINEGFLIMGWAEEVGSVMKSARLQLAPLRFGAGLKGKLVDAMQFGTPSITTVVGAEGLCGSLPFSGSISETDESFVKEAVHLYSDKKAWETAQKNGFTILEERFQKSFFSQDFNRRIEEISSNLEKHREKNFLGQVLQHHTLQSTKYLSKWIEAKNTIPQNASPVCYANSSEVRDEYK
ncbi:glycosyltransferase [Aequorivita sp. H23M31]|uniref:Glycosyltransferase n=1 Tax=Aequorivita ciconiae TaxID=2494375 RepID=A0A410G6K1_9FLAO|nr:glycosyltransferase [Aequorivita sp. H23M31]QAA82896.1 glycosyltransferase [Aequorivita sp. H23M31]